MYYPPMNMFGMPNLPMPNQMQQQQTSSNSNLIQVYNRQGVEQYFVAPNSQAIFLYENEPIIAIKKVDAAGIYTIQEYDLVPHQAAPDPTYVTRQEFQALVDRINNEPSHTTAALAEPTVSTSSTPAILPSQSTTNAQQWDHTAGSSTANPTGA